MSILKLLVAAIVLATGASLFGNGVAAETSSVAALQHILDNAGYDVGGETGIWSDGTAKALVAFAARYGIAVPSGTPNDTELATLTNAARAAVEADYKSYPTGELPQAFFVGVGSHVMVNIHNWARWGVKNVDGKPVVFPLTRFFETTDDDFVTFKSEGVGVIRMLVNVDALLFWKECDYKTKDLELTDPLCYARAYQAAGKAGWKSQSAALADIKNNPIMHMAADYTARFNAAGFHVIFTPSDFFNPTADRTKSDPLLHVYLAKDKTFRQLYVGLTAAIAGELRNRGVANYSLQSANEPRWCDPKTATPVKDGLKTWTALERQEFDAVRKVAPRLSLISAAICTAGDQYFARGRSYADIDKLMPAHPDLDGVTYSLHMRTPRMLLIGGTNGTALSPGTVVHYPYQPLSESASADKGEIQYYNQIKPDAAFYDREFADLEAFAKARNVRVMITEFDMQKPNFGTTADDRFRLVRDVLASAKAHNVPILYYSVLETPGLSSCYHSNFADHRYDPNLLRLIGAGNSVAGESADGPMVPVEAVCGGADTSATTVALEKSKGGDLHVDTLFTTLIGATGADVSFNLNGQAPASDKPLNNVSLTLSENVTAKQAEAAAKCGVSTSGDGANRILVPLIRVGSGYNVYLTHCIVAALPEPAASKVDFVLHHLGSIAKQMAESGALANVSTTVLRNWLQAIADGTISVSASDDPSPYETSTIMGFNHGEPGDLTVNTLFFTTLFKAGITVPYNIVGVAPAADKPLGDVVLQFQDPVSDKQATAFKNCGAGVIEFDGAKHPSVSLQGKDTAFTIYSAACMEAALGGSMGKEVSSIVRNFRGVTSDMSATGTIETVPNNVLRDWLQNVADGKITVAAVDDESPFKTSSVVSFNHGTADSLDGDTLLVTTDLKTGTQYKFNISGRVAAAGQPFDQVALQFFEPLTGKQAAALQSKCSGETQEFEGAPHARVRLQRTDTTYTIFSTGCFGGALGKPAGASVTYVVQNLQQILSDMAQTVGLDGVDNNLLRGWLQDVADGKVKIMATKDVPPPRATSTFEEFTNSGTYDLDFNSLFKTKTKAAGEIAYNIRGSRFTSGSFNNIFLVLANTTSDAVAKALGKCLIDIDTWDDGSKHAQFPLTKMPAGDTTNYTLVHYDCIKATLAKGDAAKLDVLVTQFGQIASDMVDSGNVNSVTNANLREFLAAVADRRFVVATTP